VAVDYQDVVPIETGPAGPSFSTEPCKRRRDKSAPCKSLQPICTRTAPAATAFLGSANGNNVLKDHRHPQALSRELGVEI
jgi:hypothetical protein